LKKLQHLRAFYLLAFCPVIAKVMKNGMP